jgi:hypothetical protein
VLRRGNEPGTICHVALCFGHSEEYGAGWELDIGFDSSEGGIVFDQCVDMDLLSTISTSTVIITIVFDCNIL